VLAVGGLAFVLILVQVTIADVDRPYSGIVKIRPVDMNRTANDDAEDFVQNWPGATLPCDADGAPRLLRVSAPLTARPMVLAADRRDARAGDRRRSPARG